jgi:PEP-CTERM motif-containing protein
MAWKLLVAGVLGASLLSTAAFASVTPLGNLDPPNASSFDSIDMTGPIMDAGTFDLTLSNVETSISATIAVSRKGAYTPGVLELFSGSPFTGTLLDSATLVFGGSAYTASFTDMLGPGTYYAEVTGTVNVRKLGVGGTVTTSSVPEPSTWVMIALGFVGLGYAAVRRSSKDRSAFAI